MQQLLVIRHGETAWSATGKHTGLTDIPLTDKGRDEARAAAQTLHDWKLDQVYSSPLVRARETAEIATADLATQDATANEVDRPEIVFDDNLVEWNYGVYEGIRTSETRETTPLWSVWTHEIFEGESVDAVGSRADAFLERFDRDVPDGTGVVFAHGHYLAILIARWCGLDAIDGRRFALATATVSLLGWHREDRLVRAINHSCGDALDPRRRV